MDVIKIEFEAGYLILTDDTYQKTKYPIADFLRAIDIPELPASKITSGTLGLARVPTMDDAHIPDLETLSYGSSFAVGQIPNLDAGKITTGVFSKARIGYKPVVVTVAATATSGSSVADSELEGGEILGYYSTGNQDQLVDSVVLNADGSVTVTLAVAATADNTFKVVVLKP